MPEGRYTAPAVEIAGRILRYLSSYRHPIATLAEISKAVKGNRSTCMRVLQSLLNYGLVSYNQLTRRYSLGPYLVVLGNRAAEQLDYLSEATAGLKRLAELTGSTCVASMRYGQDQIMYVAKEEPPSPIHVSVAVGQRFPITAGSHGKCFLAWLPEPEVEDLLSRLHLQAFTPRTITETAAFKEHLQAVRAAGYATSLEEHYPGINGVAAPVFDLTGRILLTLSIIGTTAVLSEEKVPDIAGVVRQVAADVTRRIRGSSVAGLDDVVDRP